MLSVHTFCTATSIPGFLQPRASRTSLCCWRARAVWMLCLWGGATSPKPIAGWPSSDVVSEFSTSTRRGLAFWLQVTAGYCRFVIHGHHMDTYGEFVETSRVTACAGVALWHGGFISWQACRLGPITCCISRVDWNIIGLIFELDYIELDCIDWTKLDKLLRVPRLQRIKQADEGDGNVSDPLFEVADEQMPLPSLGTRGHPKKCIWSANKLACWGFAAAQFHSCCTIELIALYI